MFSAALEYPEIFCPDGRSLANYTGNVSITDGGRQCQPWVGETQEDRLYCRNAKGVSIPWCWISDIYLDAQPCAERICGGKNKVYVLK